MYCFGWEKGIFKCKFDYDSTLPNTTFHQYLTEKLGQHPGDGIAMVLLMNAFVFVVLTNFLNFFCKIDHVTKSQWTFEKILNSARQLSLILQADFGLVKGQVVALALPNSAEFFVALLAISRCGGVSSFVNPGFTTRI